VRFICTAFYIYSKISHQKGPEEGLESLEQKVLYRVSGIRYYDYGTINKIFLQSNKEYDLEVNADRKKYITSRHDIKTSNKVFIYVTNHLEMFQN
jgi:hypothetical protein